MKLWWKRPFDKPFDRLRKFSGQAKQNGPKLVDRPGPKWIRILGDVVNSYIVTIPYRYRRKAATYGHNPSVCGTGFWIRPN